MEAPSITIEDGPPNTVIGRIADDRNIEQWDDDFQFSGSDNFNFDDDGLNDSLNFSEPSTDSVTFDDINDDDDDNLDAEFAEFNTHLEQDIFNSDDMDNIGNSNPVVAVQMKLDDAFADSDGFDSDQDWANVDFDDHKGDEMSHSNNDRLNINSNSILGDSSEDWDQEMNHDSAVDNSLKLMFEDEVIDDDDDDVVDR